MHHLQLTPSFPDYNLYTVKISVKRLLSIDHQLLYKSGALFFAIKGIH